VVRFPQSCFKSFSDLAVFPEDIYDNNDAFTSMQGSIFWMAPEVLHNDKRGYNAKIDIWSLGCLVLEMWAGRRPWNQEDMVAVMFKVCRFLLQRVKGELSFHV